MFFFWFAKNSYFKQKSSWSGQIFPILLICLAGLLVAVTVTIGIGENNKTKTCGSNAADAGSLAAASYWAAAFNKLVDRNTDQPNANGDNFGKYMPLEKLNKFGVKDETYQYYKRMRYYFNEMKDRYEILYLLGQAYLAEAHFYSQKAERLAREALVSIGSPGAYCTVWTKQLASIPLNIQAAEAALEAVKCIGAFYVCATYMKKITDFFKENQTLNFCEAKDFMQGADGVSGAYEKAWQAGLTYAFSNSCTLSRISGETADDFNYLLGTGGLFNEPSSTFAWAEIRPDGSQKICGVTVGWELSNIVNYELKHTKWNYPQKHSLNVVPFPCIPIADGTISEDPFNIAASEKLTNDMIEVSKFLKNELPRLAQNIFIITTQGKACCDNPPCDPTPYYKAAGIMYADLIYKENCIINGLNKINNSSKPILSIPALNDWNNLIWDKVWGEKVGDFPTIKTCDDVINYMDESGYSGMMVMNIDSVTLSGPWETIYSVRIFCEDKGITRTSTAKFYGDDGGRGENIGKFIDNYYPEIIGVTND